MHGPPDPTPMTMPTTPLEQLAPELLDGSAGSFLASLPGVAYLEQDGVAGSTFYLGPRIEALTGYPPERFAHEPGFYFELIHPDDIEGFRAADAAANATHEPFRLEYRIRAADGSDVWVRDEAVFLDEDGRPMYVLGSFTDVTQRKEAELRLEELEGRYRNLVEQLPAVAYLDAVDERMTSIYVSPQVERVLGVSAHVFTDDHAWARHLHPDDRDRAVAECRRAYERGEPFTIEYRMIRSDGETVWIRDQGSVVRDEHGAPTYVQGLYIDITDEKRLESELRSEAVKFKSLARRIPAVVYMEGPGGSDNAPIFMSPKYEELFGYTPEERQANPTLWRELLHPDDRDRAIEAAARSYEEGGFSEDYRMIARDGRVVWVHDETVLIRDEEGTPLFWQGVLYDITEQKRAEQELAQALEMERRAVRRVDRRVDGGPDRGEPAGQRDEAHAAEGHDLGRCPSRRERGDRDRRGRRSGDRPRGARPAVRAVRTRRGLRSVAWSRDRALAGGAVRRGARRPGLGRGPGRRRRVVPGAVPRSRLARALGAGRGHRRLRLRLGWRSDLTADACRRCRGWMFEGGICLVRRQPRVSERAKDDQGGEDRRHATDVVRGSWAEHVDDRPADGERDRERDQRRRLERTHHPAPYLVRRSALKDPLLRHRGESFAHPLRHHEDEREDPERGGADREHQEAAGEERGEQGRWLSRRRQPSTGEHGPQGRSPTPQGVQQAVPERPLVERVRVGDLGHQDQPRAEDQDRPAHDDRSEDAVGERVAEPRPDPPVLWLGRSFIVEPAPRPADQPRRDDERRRVQPEHEGAGHVQPVVARLLAGRQRRRDRRPQQRSGEAPEVPADRDLAVRPREVLLVDEVRDRGGRHRPHRRFEDRRDARDRHELAGSPGERQRHESRGGEEVGDHQDPATIEPVAEPARDRLHHTLDAHRQQQRQGDPRGRVVRQPVDDVGERGQGSLAPREGDRPRERDPPDRRAPVALRHRGQESHSRGRSDSRLRRFGSGPTRPTAIGPQADERQEDDRRAGGEHAGDQVRRLRSHHAQDRPGGQIGPGEPDREHGLERGHRPAADRVRRPPLHDPVLGHYREPVAHSHHQERGEHEQEHPEQANAERRDGHPGGTEHHEPGLRPSRHPSSRGGPDHRAGAPAGDQEAEPQPAGAERVGQRRVRHHPDPHPEHEDDPRERHPPQDALAGHEHDAGEHAPVLGVLLRGPVLLEATAHRDRDQQRDHERHRVQAEDDRAGTVQLPVRRIRARSQPRHQQPADHRSHGDPGVDAHRDEAVRPRQILLTLNQRGDRRARRHEMRELGHRRPERERDQDARRAGDDHRREEQRGDALRPDHHRPSIEAVTEGAGERPEEPGHAEREQQREL